MISLRCFLVLLLVSLFVAHVSAAIVEIGDNCDIVPPSTPGLNKKCEGAVDEPSKAPYCINTVPYDTQPTYKCKECRTDGDCPFNKYCSRDPKTIGECLDDWYVDGFEGKKCLPYSVNELLDPLIKDEFKCATLFDVNSVNSSKFLNHYGGCVEGICYFCNSLQQSFMDDVTDSSPEGSRTFQIAFGEGTMPGRACVFPGYSVNARETTWAQGNLHNNPDAVWWTIFFVFFMFLATCQLLQTIKYFQRHA